MGRLEQTVAALLQVQNGLVEQIKLLSVRQEQILKQFLEQHEKTVDKLVKSNRPTPRPDGFDVTVVKSDGEEVQMSISGKRPH